jgi:hypothetical protein
MTANVDAVYAPDLSTRYALPLFLGRLTAGLPSPAPTTDLALITVILHKMQGLPLLKLY